MLKFLPKVQSISSRAAGFTMIELLIVITILGILATAVLSAINPIEQINRGRDTSAKSDAEQLLNATERFNAFQGYYPWQINTGDAAGVHAIDDTGLIRVSDDTIAGAFQDADASPCNVLLKLGALGPVSHLTHDGCSVASQELKAGYIDRVGKLPANRALYAYNRGESGDSTYICFVPQSQAFITEAHNRCFTGAVLNASPVDIDSDAWNTMCANTVPNAANGTDPMICLP